MGTLLSAALARAQGFLLEPAERRPGMAAGPARAALQPGHLEIAVVGARPRCGTSTVARGLAAMLAVPGARPAHLISLASAPRSREEAPGPLGGGSLWEVPVALREEGEVAEYGGTVAHLAGRPAALVWDVPADQACRAEAAARAAHATVLVVPGRGEPALGELLAEMLAERHGRVVVVANRTEPERWSGRAAASLPESRIGALLALRFRRPQGLFGSALSDLAALVEELC
jgi:hypothetical protein